MDDNNIHCPRQLSMLESIIQQVYSRPVSFFFCQNTRRIAARPHVHRHVCRLGNEQRLVAKALRIACGIDPLDRIRAAAIASRQYINMHPPLFKELRQANNKRRLARAANRDIADADHGPLQLVSFDKAATISDIFSRESRSIKRNKRRQHATPHACPLTISVSAATARAVAPASAEKTE